MRDIKQLEEFLSARSYDIAHATQETLMHFLTHLKEQHCTARSMARKISSMKVFFGWAQKQYGYTNPTEHIKSPKLEKKLPQYLSEKEVEELFSVAAQDSSDLGKRNSMMLNLLYVSGVRISELTHLKCSHIDHESSTLIIEGHGSKGRVVPIPAASSLLLKNYIADVHAKFVAQHGHTDYLFPIMYGQIIKPISRQSFWSILKDLCEKTTIQRTISPHQLRHSLAAHLLKRGADLRSLQMLLGHEHVSTVQIYTHLETGYLRKIYDKKHPRSR